MAPFGQAPAAPSPMCGSSRPDPSSMAGPQSIALCMAGTRPTNSCAALSCRYEREPGSLSRRPWYGTHRTNLPQHSPSLGSPFPLLHNRGRRPLSLNVETRLVLIGSDGLPPLFPSLNPGPFGPFASPNLMISHLATNSHMPPHFGTILATILTCGSTCKTVSQGAPLHVE